EAKPQHDDDHRPEEEPTAVEEILADRVGWRIVKCEGNLAIPAVALDERISLLLRQSRVAAAIVERAQGGDVHPERTAVLNVRRGLVELLQRGVRTGQLAL